MAPTIAPRAGNSGAEEAFIQLFCDVFGPERGQYVYLQYPFVDIYGGHRTIDYAFDSSEGRIAIEMLSIFICFFVLISGSFFLSAIKGNRFENSLPVTCASIVLILFVFGLFGILDKAVPVIITGSGLLYAVGVIKLLRAKLIKPFLQCFATPAALLYLLVFVVLLYVNHDRMLDLWDEFSHWGDVVKAMYLYNDLSTNPKLHCYFPGYPPAMALFQYFFQDAMRLIAPTSTFSEWRLFFAYQLLMVSFILPLLGRFTYRQLPALMLSFICVYTLPSVFFPQKYPSLYIDPFLGALGGVGLTMVYTRDECDRLYSVRVCSLLLMLTLTKETGLFFSIIILIAAVLECRYRNQGVQGGGQKCFASFILYGLSIAVPKLLWQSSVNAHVTGTATARSFADNVATVIDVFLFRDTTYRQSVHTTALKKMFEERISLGSIELPIILLSVATLAFFILLYMRSLRYDKPEAYQPAVKRAYIWIITLLYAMYYVGIDIVYITRFSEYEAVTLASYARYIGTIYLSVVMCLCLYAAARLPTASMRFRGAASAAMLAVAIIAFQNPYLVSYFQRDVVKNAHGYREPYLAYVSCPPLGNSDMQNINKIYFIAQESVGAEYWLMRYQVRPNTLNPNFTWSIGKPFYEGDIWTISKSAEEWRNELLNEYDYVLLAATNEYFLNEYATLFSDPSHIDDGSVYKVNKETGLLDLYWTL